MKPGGPHGKRIIGIRHHRTFPYFFDGYAA
jgi:hypothetical protein